MKILFYHSEDKLFHDVVHPNDSVFVKSTSLYLKTYIEIKKPQIAKKLDWAIPQQVKLSDDELVSLIQQEKPDMFCTTHYLWNYIAILAQLERIRPRVDSSILFVTGGPSVDVNVNSNYFLEHEFVDYAFYGPGEKAFAEFIERIVLNKPLVKEELTNMAWPDSNRGAIVAEYEYVPQSKISPYLHNAEMFKDMVADMYEKKLQPIISYELTRGCPYACTFCDWNSGYGNKTTRRKDSYKDEIDLFQAVGVKSLFMADANLGQYQEDVDLIEYMADKNLNENASFRLDYTVSKLRKDNNIKIFHTMAKADLCRHFVISVQDNNPTILENIDRPDVGWDVHTSHIRELRELYPHLPSAVQLIQGLPGQTVDSWRQTLSDMANEHVIPFVFVSELLSASPAARSDEYINKWKFEYSNSLRWDFHGQNEFSSPFTQSCVSFTQHDFIEMTMLSLIHATINFYKVYKVGKLMDYISFDADKIVDLFLVSDLYQILRDNLAENWLIHNKFYFTTELDRTPTAKPITACSMAVSDMTSKLNTNGQFLKWTLQNISSSSSSKRNEYAKQIYTKMHHEH